MNSLWSGPVDSGQLLQRFTAAVVDRKIKVVEAVSRTLPCRSSRAMGKEKYYLNFLLNITSFKNKPTRELTLGNDLRDTITRDGIPKYALPTPFSLDLRARKAVWLYKVHRGKKLGRYFCQPGARETRIFRCLWVRDWVRKGRGLRLSNPGLFRRSRVAHLYRQKPNRGQSSCGLYRMARRRGDLILDTTTRFLLYRLSDGDGRAAKSDTEGEKGRDRQARSLTKKMDADYNRFLLSYVKKVIMAASLKEWQKQYADESTDEVTKCFFSRVEQAYRVCRQMEKTSQMA
ncbi:hypothetical protein EVAR_12353_1 [Eumeta japonica]|uniref:Uncharacterized protein n=1 Tax=Eumeta variegata TaxID=151549 RepID=A0A4C1X2W1_EUMVA|nr:hypothetical protein EVAR_12353_1 [Eumeta japonica]